MPITAIQKQAIANRVNNFLQQKKLHEFYAKEHFENIKTKLLERCVLDEENSSDATSIHLKKLDEIFAERQLVLRQHANVLRQKQEVREAERNPAGIDIKQSSNHPVLEHSIKHMKAWDKPQNFPRQPTDADHRIIRRAIRSTDRDIEANDKRLLSLLDRGHDLPADEIAAIKSESKAFRALDTVRPDYRLHQLGKALGKGVFSDTNPAKTNLYSDYVKQRNALLNKVLSKIGNNKAGYAHVLKHLHEELGKSGDLLDVATFNQMADSIAAEIKKSDAVHAKDVDKFNTDIQAANAAILGDVKKHELSEDDMWKFRVFQMFLMISPFAAFSILGPMFNYMGPILQIFGPVFNSGHVAGGLGSMVSSPVLGPIGEFMHLIKADYAITWLLDNVPIASDLCTVFDTLTTGAVGGGIVNMATQMVTSLSIFAIPAYIGLHAGLKFIDGHAGSYEEREKIRTDSAAKLDTIRSDFAKKYDDRQVGAAGTLAKQEIATFKSNYFSTTLANEIFSRFTRTDDGFLANIKDMKFKFKDDKGADVECTVAEMQDKIKSGFKINIHSTLGAIQALDEKTRGDLFTKFIPFSDEFKKFKAKSAGATPPLSDAELTQATAQFFQEEAIFETYSRITGQRSHDNDLDPSERKIAAANCDRGMLDFRVKQMTITPTPMPNPMPSVQQFAPPFRTSIATP